MTLKEEDGWKQPKVKVGKVGRQVRETISKLKVKDLGHLLHPVLRELYEHTL